MSSLFEIGTTSLLNTQYALEVTSQNIANANTPFFSRRQVDFSEAFGNLFGNGVDIAQVRRIFDEMANKGLQRSNSQFSKAEIYLESLQELESLLEDSNSGIANYLSESLSALNSLNANPSSVEARTIYLNQLKNVVARINEADQRITIEQTTLNKKLQSDVANINQITQKLAVVNQEMVRATEAERLPLFDKQEKIVNELAQFIDFETTRDNFGVLNIQLGNGYPLLVGERASALTTFPTTTNPFGLEIGMNVGSSTIILTSRIQGGDIGGLLNYQNHGLSEARNALGRLALGIAQKMNQQNHLGIDLNGNLGGNVLNDINSASAAARRVIDYNTNAGGGVLSVLIDDAGQLTTSDYLLSFDTDTDYQLIRKSDAHVVATGTVGAFPHTLSADGFSIQIANGLFISGDKFNISPTENAAQDLEVMLSSASGLALGLPVLTGASLQNTGEGKINLTEVVDTTNPAFAVSKELTPPVRIEFISATTYRLMNATDDSLIEDNLVYSPSGTEIFPTVGGYDPGYRIYLSGAIHANDEFNITYNNKGTGDNRNGILLANLYDQGVLEDDSLTFIQAFRALTNDVVIKTHSAQSIYESYEVIKNQAESRRDQISGVSLEEETMNLARFQQAYEANAQIIEAAKKVFEVIIGLARS